MSRLVKSFGYALNGIKVCISKGANFGIHIFCCVLVISAGIYFKISPAEWGTVLLCAGFVLCMEMVNTAIEQLCDVVHKEIHPGIKVTKDIAAGAVLLSAAIAAICGAVIFIPKILLLI
ncbi:MAG: diacylglycerol kinase family protein [Ferruginibacter sp.]